MKTFFIVTMLLACCTVCKADYLSILLIHREVEKTVEEDGRQTKIRDEQLQVTAMEKANRAEANKLKTTYSKIVSRLSKLGLAIDAAFLAQEAYPVFNNIIRTQKNIVDRVQEYPQYIPLALELELAVAQKSYSLIQYMTGLTMSIGDLYGMKAGDRKLLLEHVLNELRSINSFSRNVMYSINKRIWTDRIARVKLKLWVNREKELIGDIIENAKRI